MNSSFKFKPASFLPHQDLSYEELERIRNIKREDMEYTNENGYSVQIVKDPTCMFVMDLFYRIWQSDVLDKKFTFISTNHEAIEYPAIAKMINRFGVNCRNVNAFAMDEWADEDGNVAPHTYGPSLGRTFMEFFYYGIDEKLRPDISQWHTLNNDNVNIYSDLIDECGEGGADILYSATGWPGHVAFIDPDTKEFHADSLEEFLTLGSRIVTENPLTIAENCLFSSLGSSGDCWNVPPRAATIGPRDVHHARETFERHTFTNPDGSSWQRMVSRMQLYGPISKECPASIMRLGKGVCYVSEALAAPFAPWEVDENGKTVWGK